MVDPNTVNVPALARGFSPAARWNRRFRSLVSADRNSRPLLLALARPDGTVVRHETRVLGPDHPQAFSNFRYVERLVKFLLWQIGGATLYVAGADEIGVDLRARYCPGGDRAFDAEFMGEKVYGSPFAVEVLPASCVPEARDPKVSVGRHLDGCRIGFDLGGSDRKVAAVIDGQTVYSAETRWDPYFEADPAYHLAGIQASLQEASAHLPRVDAIGGSAAGVYVNNEVRVASLFRGVPANRFERDVRRMFHDLRRRWGNVPFEVFNDGEVTALAGSMALGGGAVLGVSMGTSQAGGYVRPSGELTSWLNELAFAPIDYAPNAPADEWSGDRGCGVQYFSQQGAVRFALQAGFSFPPDMRDPERLVDVQDAMVRGDPQALQVFTDIGQCFGHAVAHYADFYEVRHVLVLGRVTSGEGGAVILREAKAVLDSEYPERGHQIAFSMPDEHLKRHGQAVAAASLPSLKTPQR
jgi:predicted NBD/HSP70 family sugar kinase